MKDDREKWINQVINSASGSRRALPDPALFNKIEANIYETEGKVMQMSKWYYSVAAAFALLVLNITALTRYDSIPSDITGNVVVEIPANDMLISSFNIYE